MKIYLVTRKDHTPYDAYESMVVVADNAMNATLIFPTMDKDKLSYAWMDPNGVWVSDRSHLIVEEIGIADSKYTKPGVIHVSFNAG